MMVMRPQEEDHMTMRVRPHDHNNQIIPEESQEWYDHNRKQYNRSKMTRPYD